jgi:predicted RND superfamily exporter protein
MNPNLYTRLYLWLVAHRSLVLVSVLLLTVAGVVISLRINLEEDILDMLPRNDPRVDDYRYALRKFRQIDRLYLDVSVNADDPEKLGSAADELFAALSANTNFVNHSTFRSLTICAGLTPKSLATSSTAIPSRSRR